MKPFTQKAAKRYVEAVGVLKEKPKAKLKRKTVKKKS